MGSKWLLVWCHLFLYLKLLSGGSDFDASFAGLSLENFVSATHNFSSDGVFPPSESFAEEGARKLVRGMRIAKVMSQ